MKLFFIQESSFVSVTLILLIQLTSSVWSFKCPSVIPEECICENEHEFSFACSKNNENILIKSTIAVESCSLEIRCTNINDGEIFKLLNFTKSELNLESIYHLTIMSCPLQVLSWINHISNNDLETIPENIFDGLHNLKGLIIKESKLSTLTEYSFRSLNNLTVLVLFDNGLTSLPENIFRYQTKLLSLVIGNNNFATLPEKVFQNLTNLKVLGLDKNELQTLPQYVFRNLTKLKVLSLAQNKLMNLPAKIFRNQTEMFRLNIQKNNLTTLPANIFNHKIDYLAMEDNPWVCDSIFPEIVRMHAANHKDITCDGKQLIKLQGTLTPADLMALQIKINGMNAELTDAIKCHNPKKK